MIVAVKIAEILHLHKCGVSLSISLHERARKSKFVFTAVKIYSNWVCVCFGE